MFGFFKRLREQHRAARQAPPESPATSVPSEGDAPPLEERPGKSWYGSSLDLHQGLEISDVDDEVTEPLPLDERKSSN